MTTIAPVKSCAATACAFNNGGCTAFAVTVGSKPVCQTLTVLDARAGLAAANSQVGACQCIECVHNKDLMCTAQEVSFGPETANCLSYEVAS
ncbi:DUF1540 domain-containing protein [Propionibacterium australiense]|uniref:DUF1540 domain-containing protein n=1 Tax=Propionibacterium australiense TaxID=119981 RepID=A0A383S588_9ACTN|nr:DUF1540 domain-containing protein [Propionibacterium australiense]RLP07060.1 DUF1540 domain-containing protein [Propionibacterium australiense]RLP07097.1 DUF1540 domain-containing protein [Propionibacterium australiense]SYZ33168.1 Domain of unknown function DUF1540 [Propionibacterium australiense]VEH89184.1 Domain of Uncharacterised Function (DUF1540) [Propionibacterium australiense]